MTPDNLYDVLIVGGGPAGAAAAIHTRAAGLRTLVVEKSSFPRFRIGESLLPAGNALLRELGVWEKITRAGFIDKFGARFLLGSGEEEKRVVFATSLVPGLEQTFQVDRGRFDALLLDHARELGAEIAQPATVRSLAEDPDGITATLELPASDSASGSGSPLPTPRSTRQVRARHVIDAGGRDNHFASELKTDLDPARLPTKRIAIYSHFLGVARASGPAGGDTVIVRLREGWFWLIPIDATRTSVGLVTTRTAFQAAALAPADHFARVVAGSPRLRELLSGAEPAMGFHVTADYSYHRRRLAAGRLVLAGDAGGFLDPIFSSGVYLALHSAKHAAALVVRAHRENRPLHPAECLRYTAGLKAHADVFRRLIEAFYDDHSFSVFMCEKAPMDLAPGLAAIVAGHATLTWPLWWRFRLFLLVCRLQRHLPLVPRIHLDGQARAPTPATS